MKEKSALVQQATEIAEQIAIDVCEKTYKMTPYTSENARALRQYVIDLIRGQEWRDRVVTAIDGDMLFIKIKPIDKLKEYEELLWKALAHIDDEHLYDEIYHAIHGGKNGNG